ncbi:Proteinase-activated receptor 4 [Microtus ochrogaster]|uniref:Proteinase-activated receptor 4 n=1 Tax=Microtus ochrogaster TaxID=79684 RepID=A0A8J6KIN9_MICOH|nr:Proteinase-activated receptor 4 [Microtus ochrogaster]
MSWLLLCPLVLGLSLTQGTQTPGIYDDGESTGGGHAHSAETHKVPKGRAGHWLTDIPSLPQKALWVPQLDSRSRSPQASFTHKASQASSVKTTATRSSFLPALKRCSWGGSPRGWCLPSMGWWSPNGLALWVLATRVPRLPSTILLMNLTIEDLLLALVLPPHLVYHLRGQHWPSGEAACWMATAALYGHMYSSVLLLATVSLDRIVALVHPLRAHVLRGRCLTTGLCLVAWLSAATLALPLTLQWQTFRPLRLTALVLASALAPFTPSNVLLVLHYSNPSREAGDICCLWTKVPLAARWGALGLFSDFLVHQGHLLAGLGRKLNGQTEDPVGRRKRRDNFASGQEL